MGIVDDLRQGREAFERRDWGAARARLGRSDVDQLQPEDLSALATAAYLVGDVDTSVRALQQAFRGHVQRDLVRAAVRDIFWLVLVLEMTGQRAVAAGWAARAERMLRSEPDDAVERGYVQLLAMYRHLGAGDFATVAELAQAVTATGERHQDADLLAQGLSTQGRLLMHAGQVPAGLALLDESMVAVTAGEVSPILAGMTYCSMVEACQEIGDHRRMCEWTSALTRWCDEQPDLVTFTGQCALHRAQIMRIEGALASAVEELGQALERYALAGAEHAAGQALYERAEVHRLLGQHAAARADYDAAAALGREPHPGLGLLWLAEGSTDAALTTVRRVLAETHDPVRRSQLLPAAVEVLNAAGELEAADLACEELTLLAEGFGCSALSAAAAYARGTVALSSSAHAEALTHLRTAWKAWQDLGGRHEAARTRVQIGLAFRAMGDESAATSELSVAARTLAQLGASSALREVEALLSRELPGGLTPRELEVLRLVAAGRTNAQIAAELVLSEKTVARHLSNIFTKTHVTSRTAAAAYAFEHHLVEARSTEPHPRGQADLAQRPRQDSNLRPRD